MTTAAHAPRWLLNGAKLEKLMFDPNIHIQYSHGAKVIVQVYATPINTEILIYYLVIISTTSGRNLMRF